MQAGEFDQCWGVMAVREGLGGRHRQVFGEEFAHREAVGDAVEVAHPVSMR